MTSEILIKDKEIVVPGQELARGMDYLPTQGAFREGELILSHYLGIASVNGRFLKVIPLNGRYIPKVDDTIIGKVIDIGFYG